MSQLYTRTNLNPIASSWTSRSSLKGLLSVYATNGSRRIGTRGYSDSVKPSSTESNTSVSTNPSKSPACEEPPKTEISEIDKVPIGATVLDLSARLSARDNAGKSGWYEIKRLFTLAAKEKKSFAFFVSMLLITTAVTMVIPGVVGQVFDAATSDNEVKRVYGLEIKTFFWALGGLFLVGAVANFARSMTLKLIGERLVARLRSYMFKRTITQDAEFFDANRVGDLISRLSNDSNIVSRALTINVADGLRNLLQGVAGLTMMCIVNLKLTAVMVTVLPPLAFGAFHYGKKIRQISRDLQSSVGQLTKVSEERLSNVRTAQSFAGEQQEVHLYNEKVRDVFELGKKEAIASSTFFSSTGLIGNFTILALLAVGSSMLTQGSITMGEMTSYMMYAAYTAGAVFGLSNFYSEIMKGAGAASRLFELADRQPAIKTTVGKKLTAANARGVISFKNVNFSYPTRPGVPIFNDLSFDIQPGRSVCIVGPSGSGKSTLSSLILRFYDPISGTVAIDGQDIRQFNLKSIRRQIGVVQQEPVLFGGTIAENIAYGVPGGKLTRNQIVEAARKANCGFIDGFPKGLDTKVGSRGAQLSGGQKQRIAIARALIKQPSILILDEATSALDVESEALVNEALQRVIGGDGLQSKPTVISIAHRISTIRRSDWVVVLGKNGTVVEQGTFNQLYAISDSALSQLLNAREDVYDDNLVPSQESKEKAQNEEAILELLGEELESATQAEVKPPM
ncbi:hypothetical protein NADFUDRAFT_20529 [Nadsonia fulvescens var. elongata DSM 6958]|uniref:Uncharacterized protein n=1 Tax=Nadsonia fulvescens var. elongata DSM 6958 TaxID=857566 RepID=A0A1E3PT16_9ASCO|nr:hypothetical protein NADFUDRAFT_20529 [Nadsonia fulvescens var. elongata DSM 6958]